MIDDYMLEKGKKASAQKQGGHRLYRETSSSLQTPTNNLVP